MALTKRQAEECAAAWLRAHRGPTDAVIDASRTRRAAFGWICCYESRKYLETKDISHGLAGNGPIFVNGRDGRTETVAIVAFLQGQETEILAEFERKWGRVHDDVP